MRLRTNDREEKSMRMKLAELIAVKLDSKVFKALLVISAARSYRPEKYYMRGPGPQWNAKHDRGLR
jgi:hypothetical protein